MSDTDSQFDLRRRHPFARFHLLANAVQSQVARCRLRCSLDVRYGSTAGQKLDIFPAQTGKAPVFLFIHGGYFHALDKSQYRYVASRMVRQGYTVVLVNYDLAPKVRVVEIIHQVLTSFHCVRVSDVRHSTQSAVITSMKKCSVCCCLDFWIGAAIQPGLDGFSHCQRNMVAPAADTI